MSAAASARTPAAPPGPRPGRMTGRQLAIGIGLSVLFAAVLATLTSLAARAAAPHWARTDGLTVLIVAEVYLAVIAGLVIASGGPAGARDLLAVRRPSARQLAWSFMVLLAAVVAQPGRLAGLESAHRRHHRHPEGDRAIRQRRGAHADGDAAGLGH